MSEAFSPLLDRVGGARRLQLILVGLGAAGVIWAFTSWAMAPAYIPIGRNMSMETVSEARAILEGEGIVVRLEAGGTSFSVPEQELANARVALAAAGITSNPQDPGFELFDQPSWGMTDFTQRVNYRRALEGELERTISAMRGVESARVHLALQESSVLRTATQPSEASVVLGLYSGLPDDPAVVDGIASLVAAAVEGLDKENVRVLDDAGRLLSDELGDTGFGLSRRQLDMRQETERYLEAKAEQMLARVVGPGNSSVRVAAEMNFDQSQSTTDRVDPDAVVPISESLEEITPSEGQAGAGQTVTSTQFETTRTRETFQSGASRIVRLSVAVLVNEREVTAADGSTAFEPRTAEEMQRIEQLVRSAVGITAERDDEISVVSVPFAAQLASQPATAEEGLDVVGLAQTFSRPLVGLAGLMTALMLGLRLIRTIRETPGPRSAALPRAGAAPGLPHGGPAGDVEEAVATPHHQYVSNPQPPTIQLQDPAMTARVLKAWMKEA